MEFDLDYFASDSWTTWWNNQRHAFFSLWLLILCVILWTQV